MWHDINHHTKSGYPAQISTDKWIFPSKRSPKVWTRQKSYCLYCVFRVECGYDIHIHMHDVCESNSWYLIQHQTTEENKFNYNNTKRGSTYDIQTGGSPAKIKLLSAVGANVNIWIFANQQWRSNISLYTFKRVVLSFNIYHG